jgi:hypothetical protein
MRRWAGAFTGSGCEPVFGKQIAAIQTECRMIKINERLLPACGQQTASTRRSFLPLCGRSSPSPRSRLLIAEVWRQVLVLLRCPHVPALAEQPLPVARRTSPERPRSCPARLHILSKRPELGAQSRHAVNVALGYLFLRVQSPQQDVQDRLRPSIEHPSRLGLRCAGNRYLRIPSRRTPPRRRPVPGYRPMRRGREQGRDRQSTCASDRW